MKLLKYRAFALPVLIVLVAIVVFTAPKEPEEIHLTGPTMGTTYNVKYVLEASDSPDRPKPAYVQTQIDDLLIRINALMSTYDPSSELSKFNQYKGTDDFPLSAETLVVLTEAMRLGEVSDGVLDVTVGPLVNLWGFGPSAKPEKVPSEQLISTVKQRIGLDKLTLSSSSVAKSHPDLYVDLSTIAKGYAVDRIAEYLETLAMDNYLVEIGGEMRVSGIKANGLQWRIAIEKPITTERSVQSIISIGSNAIATSGDYRNYFEENGVRYSHLINPSTGSPITHNLVAVTVVHPSSMTADGLATALNVMGKDEALRVTKQYNLDVMLITREKGEFKSYTSGKFEQYIEAATR